MNKVKTIIISGGTGQLGQEFNRAFKSTDYIIHSFSSKELDITDTESLEKKIVDLQPSFFINCAAYTAVDLAETEMELSADINVTALKAIGNLALEFDFKVLHFSTDYVFEGNGEKPWKENDEALPINVYGLTKLGGELALLESECDSLILRVSWLYSEFASNFPKTINRLLAEKDGLNIVNDQVSSPTWTKPLVEFVISNLLCNEELFDGSLYHYSEEGEGSWYDMAELINVKYGKELTAVGSHEFMQAAKRPSYSKLDNTLAKEKLGLNPRTWQENLNELLTIIQ